MAQRDKERKKRGKRKYGQAKLKHAKRGIWSCVFSAAVLVLLVTLLGVAYFTRGTAAPVIGALGLCALVLSCNALYAGIKGFKEREKDYLTCKIGVCSSAFFILSFIIIFCRGLF